MNEAEDHKESVKKAYCDQDHERSNKRFPYSIIPCFASGYSFLRHASKCTPFSAHLSGDAMSLAPSRVPIYRARGCHYYATAPQISSIGWVESPACYL
jgi:hypothetical protein